MENMKIGITSTILCGLIPLMAAAEPAAPGQPVTRDAELRLPETDILWKAVKDYVEVQPVPEYQHASEAAREAIFATRPYLRWHEDKNIRFTRTKDKEFVYIISLAWPGETLCSRMVKPKAGSGIRLLGCDRDLKWRMEGDNLIIELPKVLQGENGRPCCPAYAFKVESEAWEAFAAALPLETPPT